MEPAQQRRNAQRAILYAGIVLVAYCFAYPALVTVIPDMVGAVALFVVAFQGWLLGVWGGLIVGLLSAPLIWLLNSLMGLPHDMDAEAWLGTLLLVVTGPAAGWIGQLLTRLRAQAESLRHSQTRMRLLFDQLPAMLWTTDRDLIVTSSQGMGPTDANGHRRPITITGKSIYEVYETTDPALAPVAAHLQALSGHAATYDADWAGHTYHCAVEPFLDARGEVAGTIGVALDITERVDAERALVRSQDKLSDLADHDSLTRLYNRRRFRAEVDALLTVAREKGQKVALLFLDLDGFKHVNDALGHQAGDELLQAVGAHLRWYFHEQGVQLVARLGGDEFAAVLPEADISQASTLADGFVQAMRSFQAIIRGQHLRAHASVGVAVFPDHAADTEGLLACADQAMYQAKERGRNGVSVFMPAGGRWERSEQKLTWEERIRTALIEDRFVLFAQPIRDLSTGEIGHYELLLRMVGEGGEIFSPGDFLHVAEAFGLIREIDRWVVGRAIALGGALRRQGRAATFSVNLSAKAPTDEKLMPLILRALDEYGMAPEALILEITETALVADALQASEWMSALSKVGCQFALDDFGAGFSSFANLRRLPVNYLKVDGSFIRGLPNDPVNQRLVQAIVAMARGLGMRTTAEFVGDAATERLIAASGVDYAQGYHVGRPVPLHEIWADIPCSGTCG